MSRSSSATMERLGLKSFCVFFLMGVILIGSIQSQQLSRMMCGGPAEVNSTFFIGYDSAMETLRTWPEITYYDEGMSNSSHPVADCVTNQTCAATFGFEDEAESCVSLVGPNFMPNLTILDDGTHYVNLTIFSVSRDMEARWEWRSPGFEEEFCFLNVYSFTQDPYCDEELYIYNKGTEDQPEMTIRMVCTAPYVYPVPACTFSDSGGRSGAVIQETIFPDELPSYFTKTCVGEFDILGYTPGENHTFSMTALPNLVGLNDFKFVEKSIIIAGTLSASCSDTKPSADNSGVEVECTHTSYYADIECFFHTQYGQESEMTIGQGSPRGVVEYANRTCAAGVRGHCVTKCTLKMSYSDMGFGEHTFRVEFIPLWSPPLMIPNYSPHQLDLNSTLIVSHVAALGDCPSDNLNPRIFHKCQCISSNKGNPATHPNWYRTETDELLAQGDQVILDAILKFNISDHGQSFKCYGQSAKDPGQEITFTPMFAAGPDNATISSTIEPFSLCPSDTTTKMTLTCDVSHVTGDLTPTAVLTGMPGGSLSPTSTIPLTPNSLTRYEFQFRPSQAGKHTGKCVATDATYSFLNVETDFELDVYTPPTTRPTISSHLGIHQHGSTLTLKEGDSITIKCRVFGGYPQAMTTVLLCDGLRNTTDSGTSTRDLEVTKSLHDTKCECWAEHVADCGSAMTSEISFNVQYQSKITEYEADGNSDTTQDVQVGDSVAITCKAEGNPPPLIEIKEEMADVILVAQINETEGEFGTHFQSDKVIDSCEDSEVFVCLSRNGIGGLVERRIGLNVRCSPSLRNPSHTSRSVQALEGEDKRISYGIMGYPGVTSGSLVKVEDSQNQAVPNDKYHVAIEQTNEGPSYGRAVLTLRDVQRSDVGQYSMTLQNDLGDLTVTISLTVTYDESDAISGDERDAVIGGSVALFLLLLILIIAILLYLSYRRRRKASPRREDMDIKTNDDLPVFMSPPRTTMAYQGEIIAKLQYTNSRPSMDSGSRT